MPGMTTRTKLAVVIAGLAAAALPAQDLTWAGLPGLAEQAPAARASRLLAEAADKRRGLLSRSRQPRLSAGIYGKAEAWDGSATTWPSAPNSAAWPEAQAALDWNLWRGGRDQGTGLAVEAEAKAAFLEASLSRAEVLLSLRQRYLETFLLKKKLSNLADAKREVKEDLAKAEKKAGAGFTSRTDVREFELRLLALSKEEALLEDSLDASRTLLAIMGGLPSAELSEIEMGWPDTTPTALGEGLEERIQVAKAESSRASASAQGTWPRPELGVGLAMIQGGPAGSFLQQQDYRAAAGLTVSLWDGGEGASARGALLKTAESLDLLAVSARDQRSASEALARRRMERWLALRVDMEKRAEKARQFREGVIQEYLRGVRDGRDLEEATKTTLEARNDLEETRVAAWSAWSEMQRLAAVE